MIHIDKFALKTFKEKHKAGATGAEILVSFLTIRQTAEQGGREDQWTGEQTSTGDCWATSQFRGCVRIQGLRPSRAAFVGPLCHILCDEAEPDSKTPLNAV